MLNFGAGQWVWMCRMRYTVTRGRTYIFCRRTVQPYHTKWCFPHILSPHHRLKILYRFKFLRWEQVFPFFEWITMLSNSSQRLEPKQWPTLITLNDRGSLTITILLSAFLWLLSITAINASLKWKVVYVYLLYSVICTKRPVISRKLQFIFILLSQAPFFVLICTFSWKAWKSVQHLFINNRTEKLKLVNTQSFK